MQKSYTVFASVYDSFMDNIPYDTWSSYIAGLLKHYGVEKGLVCELGCGTGGMTRRLSDKGYDMIGIDISEDMLNIAREKDMDEHGRQHGSILYIEQDMREFELYGTVAAVVSLCDSMNYILEDEDMVKVFKLVNNYLDPGGVFVFDLKTEYYFKEILGSRIIAENHDDCSIIWENEYFEENMINQYELSIFIKKCLNADEKPDNIYEKSEEVHFQRAYSLDKIKALLEKSGLEFLNAYDYETYEEPSEHSERICIIASEKYQENKLYI